MSVSLSTAARGQALVEAARSLAPEIEAAAQRIERDRQLPNELVDALYAAGLFTMLLPASFGGAELDLPTFARAIEAALLKAWLQSLCRPDRMELAP